MYSLFDTIHTLDSQSLLQMMEKSNFEEQVDWMATDGRLGEQGWVD